MGKRIGEYKSGEISFITLAKELGEKTFDYMKQATVGIVIDTIVCDVVTDTSYICMLLCQAHDAFTHQLFSEDDGSLSTELVPHKAVLPMPTQKLRAFVAINTLDLSVRIFEPKGEYDGEVCYILADKVLQLGTDQSSRDTVKKVKTIIDKVAQAHESDGVAELTMAKSMIAKNAEVSDTVNPIRIVEEVFKSNPIQQEAAKKELAEQDMMRPLPVNREFATKVGEHHKIKTDTGIHTCVKARFFLRLIHIPFRFKYILFQFQQLRVIIPAPPQSLIYRNIHHLRTGRKFQFDLRILIQIEKRSQ